MIVRGTIEVSILIRPFDRMLPQKQRGLANACSRFNPHPALRPDAASYRRYPVGEDVFVSILIRPFDRMLPRLAMIRCRRCRVSILIRPFDRMLPRKRSGCGPCPASFNPHPALRPDAAKAWMRQRRRSCGFNPHPALRPDAALTGFVFTLKPAMFQSSSGPSTGCCRSGGFPRR